MSTRLTVRDTQRLTEARDAHLRGELAVAQPVYQRLARKYPRNYDVRSLLAALHLDTGRPEQALPMLRGVCQARPRDADAHYNLGVAHAALGAWQEAAAAYRRALGCHSGHPRAAYNLAVACRMLGDTGAARVALLDEFARTPAPDTCRLLAEICEQEGELDDALAWAERCVEIEGSHLADLHRLVRLGYQHCAGRSSVAAETLETYLAFAEQAVRLAPADPRSLALASRMYTQAGQFRCALPLLETAVQIAPEDAELRTLYGVSLCTVGEMVEGWRQRTWLARAAHPVDVQGAPRWSGQADAGARLQVTCEQGIGDQLLYARLLPQLAERGLAVTLHADARLLALLQRSYPGVRFVAEDEPTGAHDFFCSLGELHMHAATQAPARLLPDAQQVQSFRERFDGKRTLGLSWLSHSDANGASKNVALEALAPLLTLPDVTIVDVQYGEGHAELAAWCAAAGMQCERAPVDFDTDIDGSAALLAALDDVVCVSNATAHLAAGVGARTHVLVGQRPVWHWLDHGEQVPWYPTTRLYRQHSLENWDKPVEELVDVLRSNR